MAGVLVVSGLAAFIGGVLRATGDAVVGGTLLMTVGAVVAAAGLQVAWLHSPGERGVTRRMVRSSVILLSLVVVLSLVAATVSLLRQEWWTGFLNAVIVGGALSEIGYARTKHGELESAP